MKKACLSLILCFVLSLSLSAPAFAFDFYQDGIPDLDFTTGDYQGFSDNDNPGSGVIHYLEQGGTIVLQEDLVLRYSVNIDKDTVLDLNGHTITSFVSNWHWSETEVTRQSEILSVFDGADVTIKNGTLVDLEIYVESDATLELSDLIIRSEEADNRIMNHSTIRSIRNCTISSGKAGEADTINNMGTIGTMQNCTVTAENGNVAIRNAQGRNGSGVINSMQDCTVSAAGGVALFLWDASIGSMRNCTVTAEGSYADPDFDCYFSGAICNTDGSPIGTMQNCTVTAEGSGGVALFSREDLVIDSGDDLRLSAATGIELNGGQLIVRGGSLQITVPEDGSFLGDVSAVSVSGICELDGGTVDKNGVLTPAPGATQLHIFMEPSKLIAQLVLQEDDEEEQERFTADFLDVEKSAYCYDAVEWAAESGITGGVDKRHFDPNGTTTRAQMVTFLWRAAGSPKVSYFLPFTDVPADSYYADAVRWAVANKITAGVTETTFAPNDTVTRAQAVTFLWRYAKAGKVTAVNPFADVAADSYYNSAVLWAVANEITTGVTERSFAPNAPVTRAQAVTFLYRAK